MTPRSFLGPILRGFGIFVIGALLFSFHQFFPWDWLKSLSEEIGTALIVSVLVWGLFEYQKATETDEAWNERLGKIAQNVFFSVLQKDLPKALIDEANLLVLSKTLIRKNFNVSYAINDKDYKASDGTDRSCILLQAIVSFDMQNISAEPQNFEMKIGLPNPVDPALKNFVKVDSVAITTHGLMDDTCLDQARIDFTKKLEESNDVQVPFIVKTITLEPRETISVTADYTMAKECEDTELLQSIYPADGLRITIMDQAGIKKRAIFAKSVHRTPLENYGHGDFMKIFSLPRHILPHQGVLVWWKRVNEFELTSPPIALTNSLDTESDCATSSDTEHK